MKMHKKTILPRYGCHAGFGLMRRPEALFALIVCVMSAGCTTATLNAPRPVSSAPLERQLEKQQLRISAMEQQLASMSAAQRGLEQRYTEAMVRVDQALAEMQKVQNDLHSEKNVGTGNMLMRQPDVGGDSASAGAPQTDPEAKTPTEVYREAFAAYTTGKHALASKLFEQFVTSFPDNAFVANARFWQGEACLAQGLYVEAMEAFAAVEAFDPHSPKVPFARLKQALIKLRQGETDTARSMLEEIRNKYPGSDAAHQAKAALDSGDF